MQQSGRGGDAKELTGPFALFPIRGIGGIIPYLVRRQALEATDKATALAEEQAARAKVFADEQAEKVKQAAALEKKAEPQSGTI